MRDLIRSAAVIALLCTLAACKEKPKRNERKIPSWPTRTVTKKVDAGGLEARTTKTVVKVEKAWRRITPLRNVWANQKARLTFAGIGSMGPDSWRTLHFHRVVHQRVVETNGNYGYGHATSTVEPCIYVMDETTVLLRENGLKQH